MTVRVLTQPGPASCGLTRDQLRSRRRHPVAGRTINMGRLPKFRLALLTAEYPEAVDRPRTRGDCVDGIRPCPYVSCRANLFLDVRPNGSLKFTFGDLEPDEIPPDASCSLDVAAAGGVTLERCAELLNIVRERVRQIQDVALAKTDRSELSG